MPEAFLTLRRGVEILGAALRPGMVRAIALEALNGLSAKSDWPRRREAASALAALAASIQARYDPHGQPVTQYIGHQLHMRCVPLGRLRRLALPAIKCLT